MSDRKCPACGAAIPENAESDLCPRCVLATAAEPTVTPTQTRMPEPPPLDKVRAAFPQWEVDSLIGCGGMGSVYKVRQPQLDRWVALKLLPPELAMDVGFAERFQREARALAKLSHPNIVTVHDFGVSGEFYYLVMEFVDGITLRQLIQSKKLAPAEALGIVPPICDALQCAHDRGIVHRDIKPENVLVDVSGSVKIVDFGIAKILGHDTSATGGRARSDSASAQQSESGVLGTPDYAAPEQNSGTLDHRADIYSLGVVLYELLTGERPAEPLKPPSQRVSVDVRIDEVVLRALERNPELRFRSASEFRAQVEATLAGTTPGVTEQEDLSPFQRVARALLPARWFRAVRLESLSWHAVCSVGHAESVWQRGGIRFGGYGRPRKVLWCRACRRFRFHRLEWREENGTVPS